jgi:predicted component of type VI protein secretion system
MFYDELYKPVKNVLTTGYGSTTKFTVRTKPNTDLKLEVTAERKNNAAIDAALKWTQTFRNKGIGYTVGGKLDVEGTVDINASANGVAKGLDVSIIEI